MRILGYQRPDGSFGIRSYCLVIAVGSCINQAVYEIALGIENVIAVRHYLSCARVKADQKMLKRCLAGLGLNANVHSVILVGLGCEANSAFEIAEEIAQSGKRVEVLTLDKLSSFNELVFEGRNIAKDLSSKIQMGKREDAGMETLTIGLKCGGSGALSGVAANPAVGLVVDKLVDLGASAIMSETPEMIGAERWLASRAANNHIAKSIYKMTESMENRVKMSGYDIASANPTEDNRRSGLTTLEEKALGAVKKSGSKTIKGVLEYGEKPASNGVYLMDGPANTAELIAGISAAGAQVILFTMGGGLATNLPNIPGAPGGSLIAPVIKIMSSPENWEKVKDYIDINVGSIVLGKSKVKEEAEKIFEYFCRVVSGEKTKMEKNKYDEPLNFNTIYPAL